jgi:Fe-S-cluster containining protein
MNNFPCTGCGACCRRIKQAVQNIQSLSLPEKTASGIDFEFPYTWNENGVCNMLTDDNKCSVYEKRPLICNIDKFMEHFNLDKNDFYLENIKACNNLMKEDNMPDEYYIKIQ